MSFTIGSLFDGSGGFPLAASLCGGTPKWASEIEPYPIAVTKSRFPGVKHLGSVTDIKGGEVEPVDVITFGSPCQDLSVAGKRAGLKHEANGDDETTRSGLFMEAVRIIKEMREATNGVYPRFAVWENVPGAFSSNKGEDFRIVLQELIQVVEPTAVMPEVPEKGWPYADSYCGDGWSIAYRVLDAQFWGVPQRRRRIYLVADFRGECAGKVSFEREGLRGYFETGRTSWQTVTGDAETGSGTADCEGNNVAYSINHQGGNVEQIIEDKTGTLTAAMNSSGNNKLSVAYGVTTKGNGDAFISEEKHTALSCGGGQAGQGYPCVMDPVGFDGYNSTLPDDKSSTLGVNCGMSTGRNGVVYAVDQGGGKSGANFHNNLSPTLTCTHGGEPAVAYTLEPGIAAREGGHIYEGVCGTLRANAGDNQMAVAYSFDSLASNSMKSSNPHSGCRQVDVAKCLDTTDPNPCKNQGGIAIVEQVPYTLKIRSGCEGGGKGALVQEDLSATLATNNDQYLFQPIGIVDSIGGQAERGWEGETAPCLKASHYKFAPVVAYSVENHPADSRVNIDDSGKVQTLTSRMGTGGGNVPMVMEPFTFDARGNGDGKTVSTITGGHEAFVSDFTSVVGIPTQDAPVYCLQGNGIDRADTAGCNGKGVKEDICYTLNTIDRPAVAFQTYQKVTGPLMANSHPGSYTGQDAFNDMLVAGKEEPVVIDRAFFNQGQNAKFDPTIYTDGTVPTLVARGPSAVAVRYIVRRLTPTECARLQGFPDTWGHPIEKTEFTDEEYQFWLNVRNTHATINDKATKEYTKEQMLKWYNGLHTDSSEYKMWGNGIALPNALYVMQGIADVMSEEKATRRKWLNDLLGDCQ